MSILHLTLMGSFLYGTQHAGSDLDLYVVTSDGLRMESQEKRGEIDLTTISLENFREKVERGAPRALDSLFAEPIYTHLSREALQETIEPLMAIHSFTQTALAYLVEPIPKNRHHFLRVLRNLNTLIEFGSYDPKTTREQREADKRTDDMSDDDWVLWAHAYAMDNAERMKNLV